MKDAWADGGWNIPLSCPNSLVAGRCAVILHWKMPSRRVGYMGCFPVCVMYFLLRSSAQQLHHTNFITSPSAGSMAGYHRSRTTQMGCVPRSVLIDNLDATALTEHLSNPTLFTQGSGSNPWCAGTTSWLAFPTYNKTLQMLDEAHQGRLSNKVIRFK